MKFFPIESIVLFSSHNYAIGSDNRLPFSLPLDMMRFKAITRGHGVLMGRMTAKSIGRALPGRRNYLLTHGEPIKGFTKVDSVQQAIELESKETLPSLFIIGGQSIYRQAMCYLNGLHMTCAYQRVVDPDRYWPQDDYENFLHLLKPRGKLTHTLQDSTMVDSGVKTRYCYYQFR